MFVSPVTLNSLLQVTVPIFVASSHLLGKTASFVLYTGIGASVGLKTIPKCEQAHTAFVQLEALYVVMGTPGLVTLVMEFLGASVHLIREMFVASPQLTTLSHDSDELT